MTDDTVFGRGSRTSSLHSRLLTRTTSAGSSVQPSGTGVISTRLVNGSRVSTRRVPRVLLSFVRTTIISVSVGNDQSCPGWSFSASKSRCTIKRRCRVLPLLGFETEVCGSTSQAGNSTRLTTGYAEAADPRSERTGRPGSPTSLTVHEWPVTMLSVLSYLCSGCS